MSFIIPNMMYLPCSVGVVMCDIREGRAVYIGGEEGVRESEERI